MSAKRLAVLSRHDAPSQIRGGGPNHELLGLFGIAERENTWKTRCVLRSSTKWVCSRGDQLEEACVSQVGLVASSFRFDWTAYHVASRHPQWPANLER